MESVSSLVRAMSETQRLLLKRKYISIDPLDINKKRISLGGWLMSYLPIINWYPRRRYLFGWYEYELFLYVYTCSYQVLVFSLTFACYTSYHMTRKTFSAAKVKKFVIHITLSLSCSLSLALHDFFFN